MPCYFPVQGYRTPAGTIQQSPRGAYVDLGIITRKCGSCIGCRLARSREWAIRCMHEASLYEQNCFATLTYAPEKLPKGGTLRKRDIQKFMKRLRKKFGNGIRYYYCGEYGDKTSRPHYHLALFNHDFKDKTEWKRRNGFLTWRSKALEKIWKKGHSEIGTLTFESAAYIARYITKKIIGKRPYKNEKTGEWIDPKTYYGKKLPEFTDMSRRGGIGKEWYKKNWEDIFPSDELVTLRNGKAHITKPPKFYLELYDITDEARTETIFSTAMKPKYRSQRAEKIKNKRREEAKEKPLETNLRMHQRAMHAQITNDKKQRNYENGTEDLHNL